MLAKGCGLHRLDGELVAVGKDYKANFGTRSVRFLPALGDVAPRALPITLSLTGVGRQRGAMLAPANDAAPRHEGLRVSYRHAACVERYDVEPQGLALSFVFEQLPEGDGDLVVTMALATELPCVTAPQAGLRYELAGIGGVHFGGVTGIDGAGRDTAGTIRATDRGIELRLPAAFVATATLPLVVDPLITAVTTVTSGSSDGEIDVATISDDSAASLCVFRRSYFLGGVDIMAQQLGPTANPLGLLIIDGSSGTSSAPTVAARSAVGQWVVAWLRNDDIFARAVSQAGTIGAEVTVAGGSDVKASPALSGERTSADDEVLCAYVDLTTNEVRGQQIRCASNGVLTVLATAVLVTGGPSMPPVAVRASQHGGSTGRHMFVWNWSTGLLGASGRGLVLTDRNFTVLASAPLSTQAYGFDVDGDGVTWTAVGTFITGSSSDDTVAAQAIGYVPGSGQLTIGAAVTLGSELGIVHRSPMVVDLAGSRLVAWKRINSFGDSLRVMTIDPFTCATCESFTTVASTSNSEGNLVVASATNASSGEGIAVILWEENVSILTNEIRGRTFASADGAIRDVVFGTGCGLGGRAGASCARTGNSSFRLRLVHARQGTAWLVLSPDTTFLACGPCQLVADPFTGFTAGPLVVDASGNASLAVPLPAGPALVGASLVTQWIVPGAGSLCSTYGFDLSSAARITIE